jgi:hypothetical protein
VSAPASASTERSARAPRLPAGELGAWTLFAVVTILAWETAARLYGQPYLNSNLKGQEKHELEGMDAIKSVTITEASQKNGLGYIEAAAWDRVARDLTKAGLYASAPNVKAAYTTEFPSGVTP